MGAWHRSTIFHQRPGYRYRRLWHLATGMRSGSDVNWRIMPPYGSRHSCTVRLPLQRPHRSQRLDAQPPLANGLGHHRGWTSLPLPRTTARRPWETYTGAGRGIRDRRLSALRPTLPDPPPRRQYAGSSGTTQLTSWDVGMGVWSDLRVSTCDAKVGGDDSGAQDDWMTTSARNTVDQTDPAITLQPLAEVPGTAA